MSTSNDIPKLTPTQQRAMTILARLHDEDSFRWPNQVWSEEHEAPMQGRFGWKAGQPTLAQQSSSALAADIGVSIPLAPVPWGECSAAQAACRAAPNGNSPQYENRG